MTQMQPERAPVHAKRWFRAAGLLGTFFLVLFADCGGPDKGVDTLNTGSSGVSSGTTGGSGRNGGVKNGGSREGGDHTGNPPRAPRSRTGSTVAPHARPHSRPGGRAGTDTEAHGGS